MYKGTLSLIICCIVLGCGDDLISKRERRHLDGVLGQSETNKNENIPANIIFPLSYMKVEGAYVQFDNIAVKLFLNRITSTDLMLSTTLKVPLEEGSGARLSPEFPQKLDLSADGSFYSVEGFFNRKGGEPDNVIAKVKSYDEGRRLDVTYSVKIRKSDVVSYFTFAKGDVVSPFKDLLSSSSDFIFCLPKPPKECNKDCEGFEPTRNMDFLYHFIKV